VLHRARRLARSSAVHDIRCSAQRRLALDEGKHEWGRAWCRVYDIGRHPCCWHRSLVDYGAWHILRHGLRGLGGARGADAGAGGLGRCTGRDASWDKNRRGATDLRWGKWKNTPDGGASGPWGRRNEHHLARSRFGADAGRDARWLKRELGVSGGQRIKESDEQ
jgi:hypothetical protein